jgi:glycosyltransferase involved in cell wall biosynthesis
MAVVSVVATVKNEVASIQELLDSLAAQSHPPDEVVIADGGSTDGTLERLRAERRLPLWVIEAPGANIAQGRNRAIAAARGEIIAVTDAGVRLHPDWLRHLLRPFRERPETMVAAGFFLPDPRTPFEVAMAATVLPELRDIRPERFWPSSRSVAFRKSAWEAVGGYPEWLDYCEDLIFDFALYERFGPFAFVPEAVVYFRPRPTLRAFFLQYYRYARGDGKADLWRLRHAIRYGTYLGLVPLLAGLSLGVHPLFALGYLLGGALYLRTPYRRAFPALGGLPLGGSDPDAGVGAADPGLGGTSRRCAGIRWGSGGAGVTDAASAACGAPPAFPGDPPLSVGAASAANACVIEDRGSGETPPA